MSVENSQTATLSELADLALENKSASHKEPHTATNELILDPELKSYEACGVVIEPYKGDEHLQEIMAMMAECLSEPYSVYTYRFFVHQCPSLCWMARDPSTGKAVGSIVSRLDERKKGVVRGYIAMLAVDKSHRKKGIGSELVCQTIRKMKEQGGTEVVLETEITNKGAIALYENLGFLRDKRLQKYYLNGQDAYRLKMILRTEENKTLH